MNKLKIVSRIFIKHFVIHTTKKNLKYTCYQVSFTRCSLLQRKLQMNKWEVIKEMDVFIELLFTKQDEYTQNELTKVIKDQFARAKN